MAGSDQKIALLDKALADRLRQSPAWQAKVDLLQSIPAVGRVASASLVAKCPELGRLNRRSIAALVGVPPLANDSGKHRGKRFVWGGRADVRAVLYMAALSGMRCNPLLRAFAERLKRAGKPAKVVIAALPPCEKGERRARPARPSR